jgi:hypothetical protein
MNNDDSEPKQLKITAFLPGRSSDDALSVLRGDVRRKRTTTHHPPDGLRQTTLHPTPDSQAVADYLAKYPAYDGYSYFLELFLTPGFLMRDNQEKMVAAAQVMRLSGDGGFGSSKIFVSETGSGKTIVIDYLTCEALGTFVQNTDKSSRKRFLLVCVPTINLGTEIYTHLRLLYDRANRAQVDFPDLRTPTKLPPPSFVTTRSKTIIPSSVIKLIAGNSGHESIFLENDMFGADGLPLSEEEKKKSKNIAAVIVLTYEHLASFLARAQQPIVLVPGEGGTTTTFLNHVFMCVFDEVHNVESGRPAALAAMTWLRKWNIPTIGLTATPTTGLTTLCGLPDKAIQVFPVQRKFDRIIYPFKLFENDGILVACMVETAFAGWMQAVLTNENERLAIFVENKLLLKIILCRLVHYIDTHAPRFLRMKLDDLRFSTDPCYAATYEVAARDPSVMFDVLPYGVFSDSNCTITFKEAFIQGLGYGIILTIADLGSPLRRRLSGLLATAGLKFRVSLSSSALAEGCNCLNLTRVVTAAVEEHSKKAFITISKACQQNGRGDREDRGGVVFCPHPLQLSEEVTNVTIHSIFGAIFPYSLLHADAIGMLDVLKIENRELFETTVFNTGDYSTISSEPAIIQLLSDANVMIQGYVEIPYLFNTRLVTLPAFIIVREKDEPEKLVPCLMQRLLREYTKNKKFNMSLLALNRKTVQAVAHLPILIQLGLFVIYFTMPFYSKKNDFTEARQRFYLEFIEREREMLMKDKELKAVYESTRHVSFAIWTTKSPVSPDVKKLMFSRPKQEIDDEHEVFALFLVLLFSLTRGWEAYCTEWGVYRPFLSHFMQNLDLFIGIFSDAPYLPIANLHREVFNFIPATHISYKDYVRKATALGTITGLAASIGDINSNVLCGVPKEGVSSYKHPYAEYLTADFTVCLENHVLVILAFAAQMVVKIFKIDPQKEQTFTASRIAVVEGDTVNMKKLGVDCLVIDLSLKTKGLERFMLVDPYLRVIKTPSITNDFKFVPGAKLG